ncbi:type 2 lanthipeptide synthetase LanM family protein [Deltaproteobacteria bacterium TL4]
MKTDSLIHSLVERALSPDEWQTIPSAFQSQPEITAETHGLLERWQKLVLIGGNDPQAFEQRLEAMQLTRELALQRLGKRTLTPGAPLPSWAPVISAVLTQNNLDQPLFSLDDLRNYSEEEADVLRAHEHPSFPEFLHPWLSYAWVEIQKQFSQTSDYLSPDAKNQLARYLLFRLSRVSARTLAYEVKQCRSRNELTGKTPEQRYQYYLEEVLGTLDQQLALFEKYPVLARLLAICTELFIQEITRLLERWKKDRKELGALLNQGNTPQVIESLIMGYSDPHHGGQTVSVLELASKQKIVYKQRSLEVDLAFYRVLAWLNQLKALPELKPLKILEKKQYGWCEFIDARECDSERHIERYYFRQGMHIALFYFLCGTDFHHQNFIPNGEYPMPVDLEGLCSPGLHVMPPKTLETPPSYQLLDFTVITTLMLPRWRAGDFDQPLYLDSGINGPGKRPFPLKRPVWQGFGTDSLRIVWEYSQSSGNTKSPLLHSQRIPLNGYLEQVLEGFKETYKTMMKHREELLQEASPVSAFKQVSTRWLNRDTQTYYDVLYWASAPDQLISGTKYDIALEMMARTPPALGHRASFSDDEKKSLWLQDIPVYYGCPSEKSIRSGNNDVYEKAFDFTSYSQVEKRIRSASEEILEWQVEIIRSSFQMALQADAPREKKTEQYNLADPEDVKQLCLQYAIEIGNVLEKTALKGQGGKCWLSLQKMSIMGNVEYVRSVPFLYSGTAGIALYLANLYSVCREQRFEQLAREALAYGETAIQWSIEGGALREIPLSGFNGLTSLVYALVEAGRCLQDHKLFDKAWKWSQVLLDETLMNQEDPDVLNGAAGTMLTLINLHEVFPQARLIEQASLLGDSILKCQSEGEAQGWRTPIAPRPLLGLAHGASGIAYALLRLYALSGEKKFYEAALKGLAYEKANFSESHKDWPNLQNQSPYLHFMTGWCAGAPGAGLARLGIAEQFSELPQLHEEIEIAANATLRYLGQPCEHLCCGEASRISFLMDAAQHLGHAEWIAEIHKAAVTLLQFYENNGFWRLQQFTEGWIIPDLMSGVSGIGLALLKVAAPQSISKVMLLKGR